MQLISPVSRMDSNRHRSLRNRGRESTSVLYIAHNKLSDVVLLGYCTPLAPCRTACSISLITNFLPSYATLPVVVIFIGRKLRGLLQGYYMLLYCLQAGFDSTGYYASLKSRRRGPALLSGSLLTPSYSK